MSFGKKTILGQEAAFVAPGTPGAYASRFEIEGSHPVILPKVPARDAALKILANGGLVAECEVDAGAVKFLKYLGFPVVTGNGRVGFDKKVQHANDLVSAK